MNYKFVLKVLDCKTDTEYYELRPDLGEHEEDKEEEEDEFWCTCKQDYGTYYVPDNMNRECSKHHYRCVYCHKVTQIG